MTFEQEHKEDWQHFYNEAIDLKFAGDFEKSAAYHLKVLEIEPNLFFPEAWHNAGAALLRVGKEAEAKPYLAEAVRQYDAVAEQKPDNQAHYLYWKAAAQSLAGEKTGMLETLRQTFEIDDSFAREALYEEDFSKYSADEDFKGLVNPIVEAIEALIFRGNPLAKDEVDEFQLAIRNDFIGFLQKESWQKDSFFTDGFNDMSVSPQACYEYCQNEETCFRLSLHLDTRLIFFEILDNFNPDDLIQLRIYYRENDFQTKMLQTLQVITDRRENFSLDNLGDLAKKLVPTCESLQLQNLDGTRLNIGLS